MRLPTAPAGGIEGSFYPLAAAAADPSITVNFIVTSAQTVNFTLGVADTTASIDWRSLESDLQPAGMPADAWSAIYGNFTAEVGDTMGGLQTVLDNDASYMSELGEYTPDVNQLLDFLLTQAGDFGAIAQALHARHFWTGRSRSHADRRH